MPNLEQIRTLRQTYFYNKGKFNHEKPNRISRSYLDNLINYNSMSFNQKLQVFNNIGTDTFDLDIIRYLEGQLKANVVLLFIDITDFSKKCESMTNEQVVAYLDDYYDKVIPIIYQYGGEIDKIMGDGIICIFGDPFLPLHMNKIENADKCSKEIITKLKPSSQAVKIALHEGEVIYYRNKSLTIPDYTIVGKMITDLFRLESVADSNAINYYEGLKYDNYSSNLKYIVSDWFFSSNIPTTLKGVSYTNRKYIQKK